MSIFFNRTRFFLKVTLLRLRMDMSDPSVRQLFDEATVLATLPRERRKQVVRLIEDLWSTLTGQVVPPFETHAEMLARKDRDHERIRREQEGKP